MGNRTAIRIDFLSIALVLFSIFVATYWVADDLVETSHQLSICDHASTAQNASDAKEVVRKFKACLDEFKKEEK